MVLSFIFYYAQIFYLYYHPFSGSFSSNSLSASQNSLYITTKLAEVPVEKVNGSLGITIRGGLPENSAPSADLVLNSRSLDALPLVVTHVRPGGAAYNTSRIKPGDRLLKVDHVSLFLLLLF